MSSSREAWANDGGSDSRAAPLVLIVDDEAPIAQALSLIVEDAGYTALTAYRGGDGLELARRFRPALVITDMMMPQIDGLALIGRLREFAESDGFQMPYIVAMTAGGLRFAQATGADAVLQKPFSIEDVELLLDRFLAPDAQDRA
ncbi:MAG TPA: response regulator [Ktedonobacterales bacterium]